MKHFLLTSFLILALLVNISCTDAQLVNLSKALNDVALGMGTLQTTVINANKAGALNDADTETILRLCFKINAGGQQASKITRSLTKLTALSSSSILAVMAPILTAVNDAVNSGLVNITDPTTKANISAALVTIQTALNTVQVILAATGGK